MIGIVRALENMTIVTVWTFGAKTESGESTANTSSGGNVNMGVAACTVGAVAAEKVRAGWHAMVGQFMRHIACLS